MIEKTIKDLAHKIAPKECIGLIVENPETHRVRTITFEQETQSKDGNAQLKAKAFLRAKQDSNIIAIFHSHCTQDERPSDIDKAYSEELEIPYYIYSTVTDKFYCYTPCGFQMPYLGRPFVKNILDCLTLTQDFIKNEKGVDVFPDFIDRSGKWWREGKNLFVDNMPWDKVEKVKNSTLEKYDGLFFAMGKDNEVVNHCGIYLGHGKMIHHLIYQLSTEDYLGKYMKDLKLVVRLK